MAEQGAGGRFSLGLRARLRSGLSRAWGRLGADGPSQAAAALPPGVAFGDGALAPVERHLTVLAAAAAQGVEIDSFCGGRARCGSCRVEIIDGVGALEPLTPVEQMVLGAARAAAGDRLACQARVRGAVRVRVPLRF